MATKASKAEAAYQDRGNGHKRCARCEMFRAPDQCTAVEGRISPQGWCRFYEQRASPLAEALSK